MATTAPSVPAQGPAASKAHSKAQKQQKKKFGTTTLLGKRTTAGSPQKPQSSSGIAAPHYASSASDDDSDSAYQSEAEKQGNASKQAEESDDDEGNLPLMSTNLGLIRSDEIDGPTDFTENMEYWMKLRLPSVKVPESMASGEQRETLEEWIASDPVVGEQRSAAEASHLEVMGERDALIRRLESELRESRRKNDVSARELVAANERLEKNCAQSRTTMEELRTELTMAKKSTEEELSRRENTFRAEIEKIKDEHRAEMQRMSSSSSASQSEEQQKEIMRLKDLLTARESTIDGLQKDVRAKADAQDGVFKDKDALIKRLEAKIQELQDQMGNLQIELTKSHTAHSELQLQLDSALSESRIARETSSEEQKEALERERSLRDDLRRAEKKGFEVDTLKVTLKELKKAHGQEMELEIEQREKEIEGMRQKAESAVHHTRGLLEKERKLLQNERALTQQLSEDVEEQKRKESDLRNELLLVNDQVDDLSRERDEVKNKLTKVVDALEKEQNNLERTRTQLKVAKKELDTARTELIEVRNLNEEADRKMAEVVADREKEWKKRLNDLKAEMELRSKLLMIEWGRREVGDAPRVAKDSKELIQGYKYMFRSGEFVME